MGPLGVREVFCPSKSYGKIINKWKNEQRSPIQETPNRARTEKDNKYMKRLNFVILQLLRLKTSKKIKTTKTNKLLSLTENS